MSYSLRKAVEKSVFVSVFNKFDATVTALEASLTWTTVAAYSGAILTAVCAREVVAPPIIIGILMFNLSISLAKYTISSNEGVINPLKPIISTFSFMAASIIFSGGTITPKSIISKLLHAKTTETMFFPMS